MQTAQTIISLMNDYTHQTNKVMSPQGFIRLCETQDDAFLVDATTDDGLIFYFSDGSQIVIADDIIAALAAPRNLN